MSNQKLKILLIIYIGKHECGSEGRKASGRGQAVIRLEAIDSSKVIFKVIFLSSDFLISGFGDRHHKETNNFKKTR